MGGDKMSGMKEFLKILQELLDCVISLFLWMCLFIMFGTNVIIIIVFAVLFSAGYCAKKEKEIIKGTFSFDVVLALINFPTLVPFLVGYIVRKELKE